MSEHIEEEEEGSDIGLTLIVCAVGWAHLQSIIIGQEQ